MGLWLFIIFFGVPALGWFGFKIFSGAKSIATDPAPVPEWQKPAGRIHLFDGDRYMDSSAENPYEHSALNWADGKIGCVMSDELARNPHYQPALIGTIQILKPDIEKGLVAVILDNEIAAAHGLEPVGLNGDAQALIARIHPEATLRSC